MAIGNEEIASVVLPVESAGRRLDPPSLPDGAVMRAFYACLQELAGAPVGPVVVTAHEVDPIGDQLVAATTVWRSSWRVAVGKSHWDISNEPQVSSTGVHGEILHLVARGEGGGALLGEVNSRGNSCTVTIGGKHLSPEQIAKVRKVFEDILDEPEERVQPAVVVRRAKPVIERFGGYHDGGLSSCAFVASNAAWSTAGSVTSSCNMMVPTGNSMSLWPRIMPGAAKKLTS